MAVMPIPPITRRTCRRVLSRGGHVMPDGWSLPLKYPGENVSSLHS
ncbi:hypothetical protein BN903_18 [Halorubrum sp. AJ67]|nr:hypothetical protein BN903_18 [Halorubrum sp. AJ67]